MRANLQLLPCVLVCSAVSSFGAGAFAQEAKSIAQFDAPEMLYVGETPLNKDADQMYPSPAMFDIDNDGQLELVVGDIFGSLNVYENMAKEGDPKWSEFKPLKTFDGEDIKVSNW